MKKLLVLGSNFGSTEIVKRAKERDIYTIVTDYYDKSKSNAKMFCDECWDISITETEKLAEECIKQGVDAVICGVSEFSSEMTFKLCDRLGLPKYCSWESWEYARNKRKFKDLCIKNSVPVAFDYFINDINDEEIINAIEFPVVVKPVDCGGNVGVSICDDVDELKKAFVKAQEVTSHKETIICERKLEGEEFAAIYALAEGEASLISLFAMHCKDGEPTNCYSLDVTVTGKLEDYLKQIDPHIKKVFKEAGFKEGLVWIEVMTDKNQHMHVLETGYRLPGGMIPYTFERVCGFNAIDWYIDCFMGIKHRKEDLPVPQNAEYSKYGVSYLIWNNKPGIIKEIKGLDFIEKKFEKKEDFLVDFIRKPGYDLPPYSLMGEIMFVTDSKQDTVDVLNIINNSIGVFGLDGEDVMIHFDNYYKIA